MTVVRSLWFGELFVPAGSKRQIALEAAEAHGLTLDELMTRTNRRKISHARHAAMWAMWQCHRRDGVPSYSLPQIGAFFGLDHTTVLYGLRAYAERNGLEYKPRADGKAANPLRSKVMAIRRLAA